MVDKGFHPDCYACIYCERLILKGAYCNFYKAELPSPSSYRICKKFQKNDDVCDVQNQTDLVMSMLELDDVLYDWNLYAIALGQNPVPVMNLQYARDVSAEPSE